MYVQCFQFNTGATQKRSQNSRYISTRLIVERFQNEDALRNNGRKHQQDKCTAVASGKQPLSDLGMLFVILNEIPDN